MTLARDEQGLGSLPKGAESLTGFPVVFHWIVTYCLEVPGTRA